MNKFYSTKLVDGNFCIFEAESEHGLKSYTGIRSKKENDMEELCDKLNNKECYINDLR